MIIIIKKLPVADPGSGKEKMVEFFNILAIIAGIGFIVRFLKEIKGIDISKREEFDKKEDHKEDHK